MRLDEAPAGAAGTSVRISDRDPDVLRVVDRLGLGLDDPVTVADPDAEAAGVALRRGPGATVVVAPAVAAALWITPDGSSDSS